VKRRQSRSQLRLRAVPEPEARAWPDSAIEAAATRAAGRPAEPPVLQSVPGGVCGRAVGPRPGPGVLCVAADTDALTALTLMSRAGVSHLPLIEHGHCAGLVLERDVLAAIATPVDVVGRTVGELARRLICAVPPDATAGQIAAAMVDGEADAVLRVRDGVLIGVTTAMDVVRALAKHAAVRRPASNHSGS
jgi:CBS domain-containing protein